jgi:hypothetical protein
MGSRFILNHFCDECWGVVPILIHATREDGIELAGEAYRLQPRIPELTTRSWFATLHLR